MNFVLTQPTPVSVAVAKKEAIGSLVSVTGSVSAIFSDYVYVEDTNPISGVQVDTTDTPDVGAVVTVVGTLARNASTGEIYIASPTVTPTGATDTIRPLGMTNKAMGGGSGLNALGNGQIGVSGGVGLNNIGLLVRTTGLLSSTGTTMTDGSGVTLEVSGAGSAYYGKYVMITGVVSLDSSGNRVIQVVSVNSVN